MGVYDFVLVEEGLEFPEWNEERPPHQVSWQTRAFRDPMYRMHAVLTDGFLYRADQPHDETGITTSEDDGRGSFEVVGNTVAQDNYGGSPLDETDLDWFRIRFVGEFRMTDKEFGNVYDIDFDRNAINSIQRVETTNTIRPGVQVYDKNAMTYEVVRVTDTPADEHVVSQEQSGHTINEEQTVADQNPNYPASSIVVIISPIESDEEIPVPRSRLTTDIHMAHD